jgi:peptidyl-lysine (3S)-dioxygenase / protease
MIAAMEQHAPQNKNACMLVQDHYENVYVVLTGSKTFTLRPPCAGHMMHLKKYPVWQESMSSDLEFNTHPTGLEPVRWCPIDFDSVMSGGKGAERQRQFFPRFFQGPDPIRVTVTAGDVLYLPALWYHYVQQDEGDHEAVIAINMWYDMRYDSRYAHLKLLEELWEDAGLVE